MPPYFRAVAEVVWRCCEAALNAGWSQRGMWMAGVISRSEIGLTLARETTWPNDFGKCSWQKMCGTGDPSSCLEQRAWYERVAPTLNVRG